MRFKEWLLTVEQNYLQGGQKAQAPMVASNIFGGSHDQYPVLGGGGQKVAVGMPNPKQVARLYYDRENLDDDQGSEAAAVQIINNQYLVPKITVVPGRGADISERIVSIQKPLLDLRRQVLTDAQGNPKYSSKRPSWEKGQQSPMTRQLSLEELQEPNRTLMLMLKSSYMANPLLANRIVENSPLESSSCGKNCGIAVRGNMAFVVAFDLDGALDNGPEALRQAVAGAQPQGVPLNYFKGTVFEQEINGLS